MFYIGSERTCETCAQKWTWTDNSPWDYDKWRRGEPNNQHNSEHCVEMIESVWNDIHCDTKKYFVCTNLT